jgi:serine/threonine protein kinase
MPLNAGQVLEGRYRIDALLGQGGMGAVYRGTDLRFRAPVAIKENLGGTEEAREQFAREAGLLYCLRHASLPRVIDHFAIPGQGQYLVMDYVEGEDLGQILARQGPIPQAQAVAWIGQILNALVHLHGQRPQPIIHRDVKPANVKITPDGRVFLVDFGLAKAYDPQQRTTTGARGVTPGYAPLEQYGEGRTDARTDVYSAGATLYALLTGRRPPEAPRLAMGEAQLVPLRQLNREVSPEVEAAVLRATQTRPADRFETATAFRTALLAPPPTQPLAAGRSEPARTAPPPVARQVPPPPVPSLGAVQPAGRQDQQVPAAPTPVVPPIQPRPMPRTPPRQRRRRKLPGCVWPIAGGAAAMLLLAVAVIVWFPGFGRDSGGSLAPTASPASPVNTPTAGHTPTPEPGAPEIEFFQADLSSIAAGVCATLQWGQVNNATEASVEPGVGGVGTPGSASVCPLETTTYVLTARGPGGTTEATTTVSVSGALADLTVDAIDFDPNPPLQGLDTEVRIAIRNAGAGSAGAFGWEWQAGSDALFDGRLAGLDAGEATVVTVRWRPVRGYTDLSTTARVDTAGEVPEMDEGNNRLEAVVQVLGEMTVTLPSEAPLDGYRGSDGSGSSRQDVLVGNGEIADPSGELVWRGFMSFDLSGISSGASVEGVELRFHQVKVGGDPYGKLGSLILEHVGYGSSLDERAYNTPAMDSVMLAQQASPGAWYVLADPILATWVEKDLAAGRSRFQVRLRFAQETDGDGEEDFVGVESGNGFFGTGNVPELIVIYGP